MIILDRQVMRWNVSISDWIPSDTSSELGFPYDAYGDSITKCPSSITGVTLCYSTILAARIGWTLTGHGVDGLQALDMAALVYGKAITTTDNQRFSILIGTNDERRYEI